ncbi:MAG: N-acetylmuramoyl-L-alanine amidase-like domain-containing protein [Pseudomonadota bacterium]
MEINTIRFKNLAKEKIDAYLKTEVRNSLSFHERISFDSEGFLGMPYSLNAVGEGPESQYENYPLYNFQETNCMAMIEHVLAIALSNSFEKFYENLIKIRYKNGEIDIRKRNHYVYADWLLNNTWLLADITKDLLKDKANQYTLKRTISHLSFFKNKGFDNLKDLEKDKTITINYIPFTLIKEIRNQLRPGDILSLIIKNKPDLFVSHLMLLIEKDGEKYIRESALSQKTTLDTKLHEWLFEKEKTDKFLGITVIRPFNKPTSYQLPATS